VHSVVVVGKLVVDSGVDVVVNKGQVGHGVQSVVVVEELMVGSGVLAVVVEGQLHWLVVVSPSDIVVVVVGVGEVYSGHVVAGHVVGSFVGSIVGSIVVVVHGGHSSDVVVVVG